MVEEIIDSIIVAENKATNIRKNADENAQNSILNAESKVAINNRLNIQKAKQKKLEVINNAKQKAKEEYDLGIKNANLECENLINSSSTKVTKIANELVKGVINGCIADI